MLKLTGSILVITASAVLGFMLSDKLRRRGELLEKITAALSLLETEIAYSKIELRSALFSVGSSCGAAVFIRAADLVAEMGIKAALSEAADETELLKEDREPLKILAESLGMTDTASQLAAIRCTRERLLEAKLRADSEYAKSGKLYKSAGILGGIFAVILLL